MTTLDKTILNLFWNLYCQFFFEVIPMKKLLKALVRIFSFTVALPFAALSLLGNKFGSITLFIASGQLLSLIPDLIGSYIRGAFYHMTIKRFDLSSFIFFGSRITKMETTIGQHCGIGTSAMIGLAHIGDKSAIGNNVSLISGGMQHDFSDPSKGPLEIDGVYNCLEIGEKVFIGERSVVMANIGASSIVGAGSVVAKDVPEKTVVVGNPARIVKRR